MANPRKFSEKIALHNQKQAEETAAFEAILRDVFVATRGAYQNQHLHIQQNLNSQYRAGSLPNVNQLATSSSIDLQTALEHLENMQSGRNMHPRDRVRHAGSHRRTFTDKCRTDCSPYSSIYLSPPADTNWRRTNSDSALHTSVMAPMTENFHSPTTPPPHRRILEMVGENSVVDGALIKAYWDPKKVELTDSRPKSCEVPNINIYPSTDQDSGIHIPISNSTTGSLPDLTVLHFPSPLTKPIDAEDQNYGGPQGSPGNLSPTSAHHMGVMIPPQHQGQQAQSPGQRRRHQGSPSPLVLTENSSQQMRIPHSPPVSNLDPSKLTMDPRLRQQYMLYIQQQQHRGAQSETFTRPPHPSIVRQRQPNPQACTTSVCNGIGSQASMTQYRNSVPEPACQSPTSPISQTSYSPAQSPGLPPTSWDNSPFGESYTLQQTNALQHQFEQFSMLQENQTSADSNLTNSINSAIYTTPQSSLTFSQAIQVLKGNQEFQQQYYPSSLDINSHPCINSISPQQQQQQQHQNQQVLPQTPKNNIPDIVFTGADDALLRQDFAKDLGNAITGFDTDLFPSDEVLKAGLDPLDLDGLQMLTDPTMVTDPATEDSFRLDRL